ncbi:membrane protein [Longispora fulva]|uniref:RND superfamily putative drug exporter n=1 Tax=Longispora fulva TaxID=619741 RepID=A0A8J7KWE1_9ACTN|nr:MMPL family transporter [Longispora fulva]MBG6136442.1 RND superfamily putative drug exporter [Longispora fulva]GIG59609.1 membrane protein [Longispora fulva]
MTALMERQDKKASLPLRRPWTVIVISLLFLLLTGAVSGDTLKVLKNGGFDDTRSDSVRATKLLEEKFSSSQPNLLILVRDTTVEVADPKVAQAGRDLVTTLEAEKGVKLVASYFQIDGDPELKSADGHAGLTLVRVEGDEDTVLKTTRRLHDALSRVDGTLSVKFGGIAQVNADIEKQTNDDLVLSEAVALPLTLILLFFVFRGLIAALLPLFVGLLSITGGMSVLYALGKVTDVSVFAVNLITALGLGLAVDYSLLIVSRYREERSRGLVGAAAVTATLRTAGRTVVFSAAIVAAVMATLLVFDQYFLRSFAYAGLAVVAITVLGALLPLPAALMLLGHRVDKWSIGKPRTEPAVPENGLWGRIAGLTMRAPWVFGILVIGLLVLFAAPIRHIQLGVPDERVLPKGSESRVVLEASRTQFSTNDSSAISVVSDQWSGDLGDYAARLSRIPHVTAVNSAAGRYENGTQVAPPVPELAAAFTHGDATRIQILNDVVSYSDDGKRLVKAVRAEPAGTRVHVGGLSAQLVDIVDSLDRKLPLAIGLAALLTLLLLFLATGSILLPIKAVAFNALGLGSILGAMVWVFQDGHLARQLDFTASPVAVTIPVLLCCVAYALSMDYEVFVLSRIKESYAATNDPRLSVRRGLGGSGPIISAAAAILAVSFFSTAISGVSLAKLFGIGTGLAVIIDAILIRGVLVPAFLRIFGHSAWWAPGWLRRLSSRVELNH